MFVVLLRLLRKQWLLCTKCKTGDQLSHEQVSSGHNWGIAKQQSSEFSLPISNRCWGALRADEWCLRFSNCLQKCPSLEGGSHAGCSPRRFSPSFVFSSAELIESPERRLQIQKKGWIRISIMNRVFFTPFFTFSFLCMWQMDYFSVKPLFAKGGDICLYNSHTDYLKTQLSCIMLYKQREAIHLSLLDFSC